MSSQSDPFRDIVKNNIHLYREAEETRERTVQKNLREQMEYNMLHEVYVRAAKCFAVGTDLDLSEIGIYDKTPLEKAVDKPATLA